MSLSENLEKVYGKIIEYGFPLMCFALAISFYLVTYDSCQIKISIVHIGGVVFFTIWLLKILETKGYKNIFAPSNAAYNKLLIPVLLVLLSGIVSYFLTPFKVVSLEELLKKIIYISIFFLIVFEFDDFKKFERLILWLILGALISSLYGIVQFLGLDPFPWKGAFGDRIFSTFGNPNFFSAYLVWTIPIMLSYIMLTKKWSYLFIVIIAAFCVYMTKSKASWIGLCAAIVMFAFLSITFFAHMRRESFKKFFTICVITVVVGCTAGVWYVSSKRIDSIRFRVFTWQATWNMINEPIFVSPLKAKILGTGIGTFRTVYPAYRPPEIFTIEGKHNTETDHPENEYLEIWYEEGLVGVGLFFWMLFMIYFAVIYKISYISKTVGSIQRKSLTDEQKKDITLQHYLVGLIAGVTGMFVHSSMCVNMRFVSSGFFFWTILGLTIAVLRIYDNSSAKSKTYKFEESVVYAVSKRILQILLIIAAIFLINKGERLFIADYHHNVGITYSKSKSWDIAIDQYRKTLEYNPNYIMTYYFLGNVFVDRWDTEKKYNPKWGDKNNIARTDAERALEMYDKVKSFAPNYVQTHFQVGNVYMKLGQDDKAIENYNKYLKLDPIFVYTYIQLGAVYSKQKNWKAAEDIYQRGLKTNPNNSELWSNIGNMWYFRGDYGKAIAAYSTAITDNSTNIQSYKNLIFLYVQNKEIEKSKEAAEKLLKIAPDDKDAINFLKQFAR